MYGAERNATGLDGRKQEHIESLRMLSSDAVEWGIKSDRTDRIGTAQNRTGGTGRDGTSEHCTIKKMKNDSFIIPNGCV